MCGLIVNWLAQLRSPMTIAPVSETVLVIVWPLAKPIGVATICPAVHANCQFDVSKGHEPLGWSSSDAVAAVVLSSVAM